MLKKMTILSALLALILVNLLQAQGTPIPPVLEATSGEQSRDPSMQPSTELPLDYSREPHKEEGMSQVGNAGLQEGEQATWELSGEPSTESTPKPSANPSEEPTQESAAEISAIRTMSVLGKLEVNRITSTVLSENGATPEISQR
ncbi:hypothetical protein llap_5227 [Limosa lapponica baueri]|uniref:Uncharacterized protein n=1 Tax=Limosa lapponica baueri TaxID=1758121 RepID=A0A2I0UEI8_LIMLA|nr:hypothetical protein llap_5227 [Limosa lapponica baueri]